MPREAALVSIAMPFYNCQDTLAAAVRSIRRQTYTDWELLLCDDGSTDASLAIANDISDRRVVILSNGRRKGLAARLNECIDRARGEYVARMDADDIAYPVRIEKQVQFLEDRSEIDLVGTQMTVFGEDGRALGKRVLPCKHEDIVANPALSFGLGHPTWLGRASWFQRYRYNPLAVRYEDVELLYRSYRESRFANLAEVLYGYREPHGGLRKRLKTRIERVRYLWRTGNPGAYQSALIEPVKAACDAVIVGTGLRYTMLKAREQSLTDQEIEDWRGVFRECSTKETAQR
jgi:glycosyltransferase involved in cell wall biosynthesis